MYVGINMKQEEFRFSPTTRTKLTWNTLTNRQIRSSLKVERIIEL